MGSYEGSLSVSGESATEFAITLVEFKLNQGIDYSVDDTDLNSCIQSSAREAELYTGLHIMERTLVWKINDFHCDEILLPRGPVQSITSITYIDIDGNAQTVATSVYGLDAGAAQPLVYLKFGQSWPSPRVERNAVTITTVTGYANTGDSPVVRTNIPEDIRRAHFLIAGDYYHNKLAQVQSNFNFQENPAVVRLLDPHKVHWF